MNFSLRNARIETLDIVRGDSKPLETRVEAERRNRNKQFRVEFVSIYAQKKCPRGFSGCIPVERHHGPYHCITGSDLSCESKVTCTWLDSRIWDNERTCLYICDIAAFDRLQTATGKISVIDRGVAVPYVNFTTATEASKVEWLMFPNDTTLFSDLASVSLSNKWFLIPQEFQGIFDYVARLHNLIPSRLSATLTNLVTDVSSLERFQSSPPLDATLNTMIVKPGGIFTSILLSPNPKVNEIITPQTFIIYPKCGAEKNSLMGSETISSNVSAVTDGYLRYHHVTSEVPACLQDFISHVHQCGENKSFPVGPTFLESEITIKEEPLLAEAILPEGSRMCNLRDQGMIVSKLAESTFRSTIVRGPAEEQTQPKLSNHCPVQSSSKRPKRRIVAQEFHKNFGVLLQCPRCTVAFKYGFAGQGLSLLIHHVHTHHKSSTNHCISIVRRRYGAVLKDVKVLD